MKIKVSIADDHVIVTNGISMILKDHPLVELCFVAHNGHELLQNMKRDAPDVLLLDIQLPDKQGDELAAIISRDYPDVAIIALTNMDQTFHVRNMFRNGVKGYLLKSATTRTLIEAIETVMRGQQYIDVALREKMAFELVDIHSAHSVPALSKRERQVLEFIADEKTSAEIAQILNLSQSTVENHRVSLFFKFSVKNAAGLVRKAIQLGLIQ